MFYRTYSGICVLCSYVVASLGMTLAVPRCRCGAQHKFLPSSLPLQRLQELDNTVFLRPGLGPVLLEYRNERQPWPSFQDRPLRIRRCPATVLLTNKVGFPCVWRLQTPPNGSWMFEGLIEHD